MGFEGVLFLPVFRKIKSASASVVIANTMTLAVYLFVTIVCFVVYSPDEITQYQEAPLSVAKIIEFRFLERFDIIFYPYMFCSFVKRGFQLFLLPYNARNSWLQKEERKLI